MVKGLIIIITWVATTAVAVPPNSAACGNTPAEKCEIPGLPSPNPSPVRAPQTSAALRCTIELPPTLAKRHADCRKFRTGDLCAKKPECAWHDNKECWDLDVQTCFAQAPTSCSAVRVAEASKSKISGTRYSCEPGGVLKK